MTRWSDGIDLSHHGDADSAPGLVDLAVNVRHGAQPAWLAATLRDALGRLDRYPVAVAAREAVARRHGRDPNEVLLTSGAAEAFVLLARVLRPRRAVVLHPQFTEPEAALRAAGHPVERSVLDWPFRLTSPVTSAVIPKDADLVVIGNPTNPTSVLHPASDLVGLCRPGRILVVDEAFADCVPGEGESLAGRSDLSGVVVIRSLTKTWGLAGLRCGYLLAARELVEELSAAQPLWPLSTPALAAIEACSSPLAVATAEGYARELVEARSFLVAALTARTGLRVVPDPAGSFVLVDHGGDDAVRQRLRDAGFVVRRGDTFPGLGASWIRVAVRDPETSTRFLHAFDAARALAVSG
jgi:histidinol-phosphate aminotransferase